MTDHLFRDGWLERVIVSALRAIREAHGPIEPTNFRSVAKRVACQVRATVKEAEQEESVTGRFVVTSEGPSRIGSTANEATTRTPGQAVYSRP